MPRLNLYAQNRHTVVVDGIPLSGFAEGDYLEFEQDGNEAARSMGGDGPSMNLSTAQGGRLSFSLMPTSPALGTMYALRDGQANNPRMFTIAVLTGTEEVITAAGCAFGKLPAFNTGGPKQTERKFDIQCLQMKLDTSGVETIAGGFVGGLI